MELSPLVSDQTPRGPRTLVLACADDRAMDRSWSPTLRDHALVLRSHGGEADSALESLVSAGRVGRVVVLEHTACSGREDGTRAPRASTAAIAAWCRLAPAVVALNRLRAKGELGADAFRARLDALVRLANLEACAEVHRALRQGGLDAHAAVYDPATGAIELFDGTSFTKVSHEAFARLITGRRSQSAATWRADLESNVHARPGAHALPRAECAL